MNNIYFKKVGNQDKKLIMLHGWLGNNLSLLPLANCLKDEYTSYLLDIPGFGMSYIDKPYTLEEVSNMIHNFILVNNILNPIIIGFSFGGRITLKMSELYNYKIVLISTPIYDYRSIFTKIKLKFYKLFKIYKPSNDYLMSSDIQKSIMKNIFKDMKNINLNNIKSNVLIMYGNKDKVVPQCVAKYGNRYICNSILIKLNGDHFAYLKDLNKTQVVIRLYAK